MKLLLVIPFYFCLLNAVTAQCDTCGQEKGPDYCFQLDQMENYCAQFNVGQNSFMLHGGKKPRQIPIGQPDDYKYLESLALNKNLKIKALEMAFILEALEKWPLEERQLGYNYTDSGLGIKIIQKGSGAMPQTGEKVTVHYTGYLEDGTKFDSSVDRGKPFAFTLGRGQVIKGWDEGFAQLTKGTRAWLRIPPDLGYGSTPRGPIPPNSFMLFEIEILE